MQLSVRVPAELCRRVREVAEADGISAAELVVAALAGVPPASLAGERLVTTTAWWWPAMAWLARAEGLNRLAAEAMAVALDLEAPIRVGPGNGGLLLEVAAA